MVRVAFVHPDLGIGGAERLVVDAALALKSKGHAVEIFTAHHNPSHCFSETKDGTISVTPVGDWLPRSCCGKGYALWAYVRMLYVAVYLLFFLLFSRKEDRFDVIVCDQISACIPVLKLTRCKILFYCHFPDMLLTKRQSTLKKMYRWPIDKLEEKTTGMADIVLVNSKFTGNQFHATFQSLNHVNPRVLYPSLNFSAFDVKLTKAEESAELANLFPVSVTCLFLSINRFERKKSLPLAIKAFSNFLEEIPLKKTSTVHLVLAGGYDERVVENKEHYLELRKLTEELEIGGHVSFVRSFTDKQKVCLLRSCRAMVYTPSNEHFGICPLEGMYMKRPVIAVNSGGPLETVLDGKTGFLCDPEPEAFGLKMRELYDSKDKAVKMGEEGRRHVVNNFSFSAFTEKFNSVVEGLGKK